MPADLDFGADPDLLLGLLLLLFLLLTEAPDLDFFALELLVDLFELLDLGDFAARLSSLERSDFFLSDASTPSRPPLATEKAKKVAMNSTPLNVKNAFALNFANLVFSCLQKVQKFRNSEPVNVLK